MNIIILILPPPFRLLDYRSVLYRNVTVYFDITASHSLRSVFVEKPLTSDPLASDTHTPHLASLPFLFYQGRLFVNVQFSEHKMNVSYF